MKKILIHEWWFWTIMIISMFFYVTIESEPFNSVFLSIIIISLPIAIVNDLVAFVLHKNPLIQTNDKEFPNQTNLVIQNQIINFMQKNLWVWLGEIWVSTLTILIEKEPLHSVLLFISIILGFYFMLLIIFFMFKNKNNFK